MRLPWTYLGRLVPISRWVRLIDGTKMYCCNGFKYDTFKDGFPAEPTATVRVVTKKNEKGVETQDRAVVGGNPEKALWRELSALLLHRSLFGLGGPMAMENAPDQAGFDFQVCAMTRDQASMDIALESVFHITPILHRHLLIYRSEVERAEYVAHRLGWAVEEYRKEIDDDWQKVLSGKKRVKNTWELKNKLHSIATTHYWTAIEKNLPLLMRHIEALGTDQAISSRDAWRKMLYRTARDAYQVACGKETPRQIRAFAKGWDRLTAKKDEKKTSNEKKEAT